MNDTDVRRDFFMAMGEATRASRHAMDQRMRPLGLSKATWRTLYWLQHHGDGVTQRTLAERMGIESPSLVRLLDNLERSGLVERRTAPTDRRANALHLTAKARPLLKAINRAAEEVRAELLVGVDEHSLRDALTVLRRVVDNASRVKSLEARTA